MKNSDIPIKEKRRKPSKVKIKKVKCEHKSKSNVKNKKSFPKFTFSIGISKKYLIYFLLLMLISLLYMVIDNYHKIGISLERKISSESTIQLETATSKNIIKSYGKNILVYNSGKLTVYDRFGNIKWGTKIDDTFSAEISTAGKYIQVLNKDNGYAYIYSGKYEIARIKIKGKIKSGKLNSDGTSIIEYDLLGAKAALGIYNKSGKLLYEIKLNNRIIADYTMSKNSRYVAYVNVDITGISVNSSINIIDLKKVKKEGYKIENVETDGTSLVYKLIWHSNKLIAQLDDSVISYNVTTNKKNEYNVGDKTLINFDISKTKSSCVIPGDNNSNYQCEIKKYGSKNSHMIKLDESPKHFIYEYGMIYVVYQKEMKIYNEWGKTVKQYESDIVISKPVVFNEGKSIAIPISNKIILFTI